MFKTIQEFASAWKRESDNTERLFDALTDASLSQPVSPDDRTLGRIAFHIISTIPEMLARTGLKFENTLEGASVPSSAETLANMYRKAAQEALALIQAEWNDDTLFVEDDMYGEKWPRGVTLGALIGHEIHHRGQMTVLMRQAGLVVPGIYGPAREEWERFGMKAPEI